MVSAIDLSCGCVERKVGGSSVKFDRGIVGLPMLGAYAVTLVEVVARASDLISGVR